MKNKYFTLISSFLLSISSFGQLTEIITLEDAKAYALEHHTKVKNSIQDIEMARQQMIEVRGMGLPQINLTGSFSNFINLPVQVVDASFINPMAQPGETIEFKAGTDYTMNGTLNVNQLIFNGSYIVGLQVASYFNKFQQTATQISKEEVVFNVIQAYEMAAIAKLNLELADSIFLCTGLADRLISATLDATASRIESELNVEATKSLLRYLESGLVEMCLESVWRLVASIAGVLPDANTSLIAIAVEAATVVGT